MKKEFIRKTGRSVTLNVTAGKIDSFREIEKTTGTVRVYENGCIGVAGCLGEPNEKELTEKAKEALAFAIPYPEKLEGALEMQDIRNGEIIPVPKFIPTMQRFLDRLGELCPNFAFSNKISISHNSTEYKSSNGRHLASSGRKLSIELLAQSRGSGNLFDTGFFWSGDSFDEEALLKEFKREYDAFFVPVDIESGRYPVVIGAETILYRYFNHFVSDMYAAGASLLSGMLGEKVFSDKLTLKDDMNPETAHGECFFDAEGCIAPDRRPALIENGVLKGLLTTKKSADTYGIPNLGSAGADYDGVPETGFHGVYLTETAKSIRELVPGKAILVMIAEGGDVTPGGHFATPVQLSYLMEDGELKGRLPELNISGDFFDLLGKDYIGTVHDDPLKGFDVSAFEMDVEKA
ncbi:MAG: hypothetical protein IJI13_04960 [Oscillospiraceae bacterium]|nr:hypothetical protein [Oscillospiraceae bacterium]